MNATDNPLNPSDALSKRLFLMIVGGAAGFLLATGALLTLWH
jgi:hypothetical protein